MPIFPDSELIAATRAADSLYHRLVLVAGPVRSGKTEQLRTFNLPIHNVNLSLSTAMLDLSLRRRPLEAPRLVAAIIAEIQTSPVILDNLELLFDVSLKLDPISCLRQASRHRTIVATFPGVLDDGQLVYAEPNHPEYRRFPADDLLIVNLASNVTA